MPGVQSERTLQNEIVRELLSRGWVLGEGSKAAGKYDFKRALYTEDALAWLRADKPEEYAKVKGLHNGGTEAKILDRLDAVLRQRGAIDVLRNGFKDVNASFEMCAFPPNSGMNPTELARSAKVVLRIVPELQYSAQSENRLDLAFFVNGIPVATLELKTDNTQSVDAAIKQYREDRPPKDEPLLTWKRGALVHFAVSSQEAYMTTRLEGAKTHFLPFNRGNHGGAGNPPDQGINYLWEEILDRDAWLEILKAFICIEKGKTLLFPRYHQWDAVTKLVAAAKAEGAGQRYLVQHSAGSGKSYSIMWLAHRLAHLYNAADEKVFDTVFVLTDRTVLDEQLAEAVQQFEHRRGTIARIDDKGASKSDQLKQALDEKVPIVIVTLQTFPFVAEKLDENSDWKQRTFAIVADEAHSSQTGNAAKRIREILGFAADEEVGLDDELAAQQSARAGHANISYFAFTATPKHKTLELFGTKGDDGKPKPFHLYTMRQAIEEGFILDVLENYTTYEMAYKVATASGVDTEVPKGKAAQLIAKMVKLHSYTIAQKVAIIVEHFRETVAPLLDGKGKAMVVTDSREAAVRYKKQMDRYIKDQGYTDLQTLVAFSGEVKLNAEFPGEWTEARMNVLRGQDIPEAFNSHEYQVLIVAEKYQTGFDQPKLCGMYVDKTLHGIAAVQTLSRLNRVPHGQIGKYKTTYVLDFVNAAEHIQEAFQPYYESTNIEENSDPNRIHDLIHAIDGYGMPHLYGEADIEAFAKAYFDESKSDHARQSVLNNLIGPIKDRFVKRREAAIAARDTEALEAGKAFRKQIVTFGRAYRFLSQLYDFGDAAIAKREVFYDYLARNIRESETGELVDISDVRLTHLKLAKTSDGKIALEKGAVSFLPGSATGEGLLERVKAYTPLSEVIRLMNEFFGEQISDENQISLLADIMQKGVETPDLVTQAGSNTMDKFMLGDAPKLVKQLTQETYYERQAKSSDDARQLDQIGAVLADDAKMQALSNAIGIAIYKTIRDQRPQPGG